MASNSSIFAFLIEGRISFHNHRRKNSKMNSKEIESERYASPSSPSSPLSSSPSLSARFLLLLISLHLFSSPYLASGSSCPAPVPPCSCKKDTKELFCQSRKFVDVPRLEEEGFGIEGAGGKGGGTGGGGGVEATLSTRHPTRHSSHHPTSRRHPTSPHSGKNASPSSSSTPQGDDPSVTTTPRNPQGWSLNLANNDLDSISPNHFSKVRLRSLSLDYNRFLRKISGSAFAGQESTLTRLTLAGTGLTEVPTRALLRLDALEEFDFSSHKICVVDDFVWPEKLQNSVRKIKFAGNCLSVFPAVFAGAESLDLSKNKLDDVPLEDLKRMAISSSSSSSSSSPSPMKELKLANNLFTAIPSGIQMLTKLETLDLRNNRISAMPEWLVNEMRTRMTSLRWFGLANNRLPCRRDDCGMYRLWKWLKEEPELFGEPSSASSSTSMSSRMMLRTRRSRNRSFFGIRRTTSPWGNDPAYEAGDRITCFGGPSGMMGRPLGTLSIRHWTCPAAREEMKEEEEEAVSGKRREANGAPDAQGVAASKALGNGSRVATLTHFLVWMTTMVMTSMMIT